MSLIACSNIVNKEENDINTEHSNEATDLESDFKEPESDGADSQQVRVHDFVSPDHTWGVRLYTKTFESRLPGFKVMLLNDEKEEPFQQPIVFDREDLMLADPVVWISKNRVVINGEWIFDQSNNSLTQIAPKLDWIYTYSFSPDKRYLARCEKSDNSSQFGMEIRLFDLEDLSNKTVYFFPGAKVWTSGIFFSIAWTDYQTFVFDGNLDEQPTVFQYSLTSEKVETIRSKAWSPRNFSDSSFLSFIPVANYYTHAEEIIVQDKGSGAEIGIPGEGILYWVDQEHFLLVYRNELSVYRMENDLTYSKKPIKQHSSSTPVLVDRRENNLLIKYLKSEDNYRFSIEEEMIELD